MSAPKFTPGPWSVERHSSKLSKVEARNRVVCDAFAGSAEDDANAQLIAAAPELMAAVWLFVQAASAHPQMDGSSTITGWDRKRLDAAWPIARAALAKARGEVLS